MQPLIKKKKRFLSLSGPCSTQFRSRTVCWYYVFSSSHVARMFRLMGLLFGVSASSVAPKTSGRPARTAGVCIFMLREPAVRGRAVRPQRSAKSHVPLFAGSKRSSYTTCHLSDSVEFAEEQSQGAASRTQQRSRSGGSKYEPSSLSSVC